MKDILQDIIANKRIEVERQKQAVRLQTLLGMGGERLEHPARSMRAALAASSSGIIAEGRRFRLFCPDRFELFRGVLR